jgi:hypothetical protein
MGGEGQHRPGGARARKDEARGSLTGALCTKFTLILKIAAVYNSFTVEKIDQACTPS